MFEKSQSEKPEDRFRSVDFVAAEIFDAMPDLAKAGSPEEEQIDALSDNPNVVNLFATGQDKPKSGSVIADSLGNTLLRALDELNKAAKLSVLHAEKPDFLAGPGGAEILRGQPSARSDDEMLASIRALIAEQDEQPTAQADVAPESAPSAMTATDTPAAVIEDEELMAEIISEPLPEETTGPRPNTGSTFSFKNFFGKSNR